MAISSMYTFLMHNTAAAAKGLPSWEKLVDIKDFPNLGGAPEMLETTTLSDKMQTFIAGIQKLEAMEFTSNYTLTDYKKLLALTGKESEYAVWFGGSESLGVVTPDGKDGKFKFNGELSVYAAGGGVNSVDNMKITIAPSTPITLDATE